LVCLGGGAEPRHASGDRSAWAFACQPAEISGLPARRQPRRVQQAGDRAAGKLSPVRCPDAQRLGFSVFIRIAKARTRSFVATAFAATIDAMASTFAWAAQQLGQLSGERRIHVSQIRSPLVSGATPRLMQTRK